MIADPNTLGLSELQIGAGKTSQRIVGLREGSLLSTAAARAAGHGAIETRRLQLGRSQWIGDRSVRWVQLVKDHDAGVIVLLVFKR